MPTPATSRREGWISGTCGPLDRMNDTFIAGYCGWELLRQCAGVHRRRSDGCGTSFSVNAGGIRDVQQRPSGTVAAAPRCRPCPRRPSDSRQRALGTSCGGGDMAEPFLSEIRIMSFVFRPEGLGAVQRAVAADQPEPGAVLAAGHDLRRRRAGELRAAGPAGRAPDSRRQRAHAGRAGRRAGAHACRSPRCRRTRHSRNGAARQLAAS